MNIEELIHTVEDLNERASQLQISINEEVDAAIVHDLRNDYVQWYAACLARIPLELKNEFVAEYNGSLLFPKIRSFLDDPRKRSVIRFSKAGSGYWQYTYERTFRDPIRAQQSILARAGNVETNESLKIPDAISVIELIAKRFHSIAVQLQVRYGDRPPFQIHDEYDVQYLLHALLMVHFDDIRPEDYIERYGAKNYRPDFVLKNERIVIEVKKTRYGMKTYKIQEELAIDIDAYRMHSSCDHFIAFIYDPDSVIKNPVGWVNDLNGSRGTGINVKVFVVQR